MKEPSGDEVKEGGFKSLLQQTLHHLLYYYRSAAV
jgi:hypothetical protein